MLKQFGKVEHSFGPGILERTKQWTATHLNLKAFVVLREKNGVEGKQPCLSREPLSRYLENILTTERRH